MGILWRLENFSKTDCSVRIYQAVLLCLSLSLSTWKRKATMQVQSSRQNPWEDHKHTFLSWLQGEKGKTNQDGSCWNTLISVIWSHCSSWFPFWICFSWILYQRDSPSPSSILLASTGLKKIYVLIMAKTTSSKGHDENAQKSTIVSKFREIWKVDEILFWEKEARSWLYWEHS